MQFIETSIFTREIDQLLPDEEYRRLQLWLLFRPDAGALIKGSGGLRKVRWRSRGSGKSGGVRAIYYWNAGEEIFMLFAYKKGKQEDLSPQQLTTLKSIVKEHML